MFSEELETRLSEAYVLANQQQHATFTMEHVLSALLDESSVSECLVNYGTDIPKLREALAKYIVNKNTSTLTTTQHYITQCATNIIEILAFAIGNASSRNSNKTEGVDVLIAIFKVRNSHALYILLDHGVTRQQVDAYLRRE